MDSYLAEACHVAEVPPVAAYANVQSLKEVVWTSYMCRCVCPLVPSFFFFFLTDLGYSLDFQKKKAVHVIFVRLMHLNHLFDHALPPENVLPTCWLLGNCCYKIFLFLLPVMEQHVIQSLEN